MNTANQLNLAPLVKRPRSQQRNTELVTFHFKAAPEPSMSRNSNIETTIASEVARVMENSLRPFMERLQQFEEKVSRIDETVRNLQTVVTDINKNVATVLQCVKNEGSKSNYLTVGGLSPSSSASPLQSLSPTSCVSIPVLNNKYIPTTGTAGYLQEKGTSNRSSRESILTQLENDSEHEMRSRTYTI